MLARARTFAVLGAYLCLATHVVGVLHVLVVRHATCPDHGEVVHGEAPALAEVALPDGQTRAGAPQAAEEADEHCLLLATRRRDLVGVIPTPEPIVLAPAATSIEPPPLVAAAAPRALLRLAPKTSPPAVA